MLCGRAGGLWRRAAGNFRRRSGLNRAQKARTVPRCSPLGGSPLGGSLSCFFAFPSLSLALSGSKRGQCHAANRLRFDDSPSPPLSSPCTTSLPAAFSLPLDVPAPATECFHPNLPRFQKSPKRHSNHIPHGLLLNVVMPKHQGLLSPIRPLHPLHHACTNPGRLSLRLCVRHPNLHSVRNWRPPCPGIMRRRRRRRRSSFTTASSTSVHARRKGRRRRRRGHWGRVYAVVDRHRGDGGRDGAGFGRDV